MSNLAKRDWVEWHSAYDRDSSLRRRLHVVHARISECLDACAAGPIRVVSLCAGQGRDLIPVVARHPRRHDIRARLVELDPRNARTAAAGAGAAGLDDVEVVQGDAALTSSYAGAVPADLVLVCGVFGNISDADIAYTIEQLPMLCAPGATVIWTRGRRAPDLTPTIRSWFARHGFEELSFEGKPGSFRVGVHRLTTSPKPFDPTAKLFSFRPRPAPTP